MTRKTVIIALGIVAFLMLAAWTVSLRTPRIMNPPPSVPGTEEPRALEPGSEERGSLSLPVLADAMPEFAGIEAWLNSEALTPAELKGKVVLIDFWTYSCINCIRTLPYVTAWHEKYKEKGFTVIGVHTPEFAFEKVRKNVETAVRRHGITYPVAQDNAFATWNNYSNRYWPAHYLFDAQGRLRHYHFGEGEYAEMERAIQALIVEAGGDADMAVETAVTPEFRKIGTPETYLGYERMEHLGSPETVARDARRTYSAAAKPALNRFYFSGEWRIEGERALPLKAGAKIIYRYTAAKVNLVMGPTGSAPAKAKVLIDGKLTKELIIDGDRLYELHDDGGAYGEHVVEIEFIGADAAAYAFTFG